MKPSFAVPQTTALTDPFWQGCRRRQLMVPVCEECRRGWFYPTLACPHCGSRAWEWRESSGTGTIYSWTTIHRSADAEWQAIAPFTVAIVALDDFPDARIPGLLTPMGDRKPGVGDSASVDFDVVDESYTRHRWIAGEPKFL